MCVDNSAFAACAPVGPGVVIVVALSSTSPCARLPPRSRVRSSRAPACAPEPPPPSPSSVMLALSELFARLPGDGAPCSPLRFAALLRSCPIRSGSRCVSGASIDRASLPGVHRCASLWSPLLPLCCAAVLAGFCPGPSRAAARPVPERAEPSLRERASRCETECTT